MTTEKVLALLQAQRGHDCSGEEMSRTLGVSRASVWKAVERLRQQGYHISSASNRGYRLTGAPDRLRPGALAGPLEGCLLGRELVCLDAVDSTNSEVKRRRLAGAQEGLAVIAAEQTQGRGRLGRSFQSPAGQGLYLSVLLTPNAPLAQVAQLTAWAAVAVCRGIEACCGVRPGIKWPNDLIVDGKKLCGILTELELEAESGTLAAVILGMGVNAAQTADDFGPALAPVATSLLEVTGRAPALVDLAACILRALDALYARFPGGGDEVLRHYRAACVTTGHPVSLVRGGVETRAFAEEITSDFGLLVRHEDQSCEIITSGEVSVRGILGYV